MGGKDNRILLILHTAVFLAGWTGIFGRLISLGGLPLVWYRVIISVAILFIVMAALGKLQKVSRKEFFRIAGCGCLLALHWVAFYASIQASNVSVGVVCVATSCFFTALFNPLINRKRISWMELLISFIAITGVLLIFSLDIRYRLGIALGLLSSAIYSLFAIFNVNVANETGRDSATMLLYELAGGVILLTVMVPLYTLVFPGEAVVPSRMDWIWLLLLSALFTILPFLFQIQALRHLSAFTVNLAYNLEPLYSIVIAAILFGEMREVGVSFWIGVALIIISVVIQTWRVKRQLADQ